MGRAMEMVSVQATAPGAGGAAGAAVSGNSLTIRDSRKAARIVGLWSNRQGVGGVRLTSPLIHDTTYGISNFASVGGQTVSLFPIGQPVQAQDTLTATITGSATAGDIEQSSFIVAYDDLPGVEGRFFTAAQIRARMVNLFTTVNTLATGTAGGYSGSELVGAETDAFKANVDYALLGATVYSAAACSIRYDGPDWGNLGIGLPAFVTSNNNDMAYFFLLLSELTNLPLIPVMNASNKGLTNISALQNEVGADPIVVTQWAELR